MSELDEFKATYFDECSELLTELEEQFAFIEGGDHDSERLNAVFRAIHSIKGGAGAFGFTRLVDFAHSFETLLDFVRDGRVELNEDVVALCIRSSDLVADFVSAAREGRELDPDHGAEQQASFEALCHAGGGGDEDDPDEFDIDFTPVMVVVGDDGGPGDDSFEQTPFEHGDGPAGAEDDNSGARTPVTWVVNFTPFRTLLERANDPLLLLRELHALGEARVEAHLEQLPQLQDFEPFHPYCSWTIRLAGEGVTEERIREVFEFVEGDCAIEIAVSADTDVAGSREPGDAPDAVMSAADDDDSMPSFEELAGALGVGMNVPAPSDAVVEDAPATQSGSKEAPVTNANASADMAKKTPPPSKAKTTEATPAVQSIRVDLDKVDRVVNMVGELVITQSMLTQQMDETLRDKYQELVRGIEVLAQTTRGLQDSVMAIRAQPVKSVFSRMPRLVRELASKTGKKIKLEMSGEHTEIDKTVIEQLSDPLTHMIRNSADHGIESIEDRLGNGKGEQGTIMLSAEQAGGNILIIVEDDGAGINRERVLSIARDRGIVPADQTPTDEQIDNLVFAPGFSTASEISDISGRGVGMDVVLSNIKKIGGTVHVRSKPGRGTRMTLRLPLTLAVLDVMLVNVGGCPYVVPLSSIVETMQAGRADFGIQPSGAKLLRTRGQYVQVIDLAASFSMATEAEEKDRFVVLCEAEGTSKLAIVVDEIIGQQQVVIKSLEENYERIDGIAGGTILGDGQVALIVDVPGLQSLSAQQSAAA